MEINKLGKSGCSSRELVGKYLFPLCIQVENILKDTQEVANASLPQEWVAGNRKVVVGLELYLLNFITSKCVTYFEMCIQSNQKVPAAFQFLEYVIYDAEFLSGQAERETLLGERLLLVVSGLAGGLFSMEMSSSHLRERPSQ